MSFDAVTYAAARSAARHYTDEKVAELPSGYTYKGKVANFAALPLTGNAKGDMWITEDNGHEYVWSIDASSGTADNWVDKSKDLSKKIDNPTDSANNDTLIYDEDSNKWIASSLKTVNGQALLGNGDVKIKTYQEFPSTWRTNGTLREVTESILQDTTYTKKGMAYLGGIRGECTPFGYGNVECTVSFMVDGIAVLNVSSSDIAPYHWEYNTDSYDYIWKKSSDVIANPTATATESLKKISIDGQLYKIDGKTYTAGSNITITNDTINAKDTTYSAGTNVTIDANNVITSKDTTYTAGTNVTIDANNVITSKDTTYAAGSNITITQPTNAAMPVISATDTTYTAGTHVTITDEVITADDNLQQQITVTNPVGDIAAGEVLPIGTSLEQIVRRMLMGSTPPVTGITFMWGAIDAEIPTLTDLSSLNKAEGLDKATLIANGIEKNIVSHYVPALDLGQVQVVAVTNTLTLKDWKNKATGWSYAGNYAATALGSYNVYYFTHRVDSEPDGEDMKFEFQEA